MNKNSRGFAPLIIVIVLTLIGLAGYIVFRSTTVPSPTPSETLEETANWKTYTNTKYKYQIDYPPNWSIEVLYPSNSSVETAEGVELKKLKGQPSYAENQIIFDILAHPNPRQRPLKEYLLKEDINLYHPELVDFATLGDRQKIVESMEKTTFKDFEAFRDGESKLFLNLVDFVLLFYMETRETTESSTMSRQLFDQILPTFKTSQLPGVISLCSMHEGCPENAICNYSEEAFQSKDGVGYTAETGDAFCHKQCETDSDCSEYGGAKCIQRRIIIEGAGTIEKFCSSPL